MAAGRIRCFFDVEIDGVPQGRIIFELFSDVAPKTCENFRGLCTGEYGMGKTTKKPLHYRGVKFHRVIKDFMVQAGDFSASNGTGGESVYGGQFEDETFEISHDTPFLLSMANRGKNTNGSQFFITTQTALHLDQKHVVFGRVLSGQEVVAGIEDLAVDNKSRPLQMAVISNCGELVLQRTLKSKAKEKKKKKLKKVEEEEEESDDEKKKRKKRKEKKNKHRKEKSSDAENGVPEEPEQNGGKSMEAVIAENFKPHPLVSVSHINPDEIPEVPRNRFLDRAPVRREVDDYEPEDDGRMMRSEVRFRSTRFYTRSGRKVKGRGSLRYRTPSRSKSRSRSQTPPHWKQAQRRVVSMDKLQRRIEKEQEREREREERRRRRAMQHKQADASEDLAPVESSWREDELYSGRMASDRYISNRASPILEERRHRREEQDWRAARKETLQNLHSSREDHLRGSSDLREKLNQSKSHKAGRHERRNEDNQELDDMALNYEASSSEGDSEDDGVGLKSTVISSRVVPQYMDMDMDGELLGEKELKRKEEREKVSRKDDRREMRERKVSNSREERYHKEERYTTEGRVHDNSWSRNYRGELGKSGRDVDKRNQIESHRDRSRDRNVRGGRDTERRRSRERNRSRDRDRRERERDAKRESGRDGIRSRGKDRSRERERSRERDRSRNRNNHRERNRSSESYRGEEKDRTNKEREAGKGRDRYESKSHGNHRDRDRNRHDSERNGKEKKSHSADRDRHRKRGSSSERSSHSRSREGGQSKAGRRQHRSRTKSRERKPRFGSRSGRSRSWSRGKRSRSRGKRSHSRGDRSRSRSSKRRSGSRQRRSRSVSRDLGPRRSRSGSRDRGSPKLRDSRRGDKRGSDSGSGSGDHSSNSESSD